MITAIRLYKLELKHLETGKTYYMKMVNDSRFEVGALLYNDDFSYSEIR